MQIALCVVGVALVAALLLNVTCQGRLWGEIHKLCWRLQVMQESIEDLRAQVAETTTLMASAAVLIGGLADRIEDAKNDPEELAALTADLRDSSKSLADAIVANTPEAPVEE